MLHLRMYVNDDSKISYHGNLGWKKLGKPQNGNMGIFLGKNKLELIPCIHKFSVLEKVEEISIEEGVVK